MYTIIDLQSNIVLCEGKWEKTTDRMYENCSSPIYLGHKDRNIVKQINGIEIFDKIGEGK